MKAGTQWFQKNIQLTKAHVPLEGHEKNNSKTLYCTTMCAKHNIKVQQIQKEHFNVPIQPMEFIAMDLIAEFHPPSAKETGMHSLQYAC